MKRNFITFRLILALMVAWLCGWEVIWEGVLVVVVVLLKLKSPFNFIFKIINPRIKSNHLNHYNYFKNYFNNYNFISYFYKMPEPKNHNNLVHLLQWIRDTSDEIRFAWSSSYHSRQSLKKSLQSLHPLLPPHSDLLLTAIGTLSLAALLRRSLRRFKTASDVPINFFNSPRKGTLKGVAVAVNDSDNLRFYHQPNFFFSLFKPNLSRQGIQINIIRLLY